MGLPSTTTIGLGSHAQLPPEIWHVIFVFATYYGGDDCNAAEYTPFQPCGVEESTHTLEESIAPSCCTVRAQRLKTCSALVRVCRLWRTLSEAFLYKDIRIGSIHVLRNLVCAMRRSATEDGIGGLGRFVKRLELRPKLVQLKYASSLFQAPLPSSGPPTVGLGDLLRYCPYLETLARLPLRLDAEGLQFWGALASTPLESDHFLCPHLKRLEWSESDLDMRFYGTSNQMRLSEIVSHSPELRFLVVDRPDRLFDLPLGRSLQTIRLNQPQSTCRPATTANFCIPCNAINPTNLILHMPVSRAMQSLMVAIGLHIRVLELTFAPQVTYSSKQMHRIFVHCPHLEQLAYHLGAPELSPLVGFHHHALRRVRLRIDLDEWFPYKQIVLTQFEILAGPSFPGLKQIVLHDKSRSFSRRASAAPLLRRIASRGCAVIHEDGSAAYKIQVPRRTS
ncbi:t-SNARE coiled-coil-like proteiny domain-containing protein [Favolaschia claudopus]|uniref:t-SNARE coiled-coil-like proteiny domain-containing protein n=1 Tax=Favolaschia claudopus TaxID=2862362 RepID=A0AAW0EA97_9AGAR